MNLDINRKNVVDYLKEFKQNITIQKSLFGKKVNLDVLKLKELSDKIVLFFERGILISPMSIDKNSINTYIENIDLVKQFPLNFKPDVIMESKILEQTKRVKKTRTILLPSIVENNSQLMEYYDKMVAYYLLMNGDKPIERFSKVEMSMKHYGIRPDVRSFYNEIWIRNNRKIRRNSFIKSKLTKRMGIL